MIKKSILDTFMNSIHGIGVEIEDVYVYIGEDYYWYVQVENHDSEWFPPHYTVTQTQGGYRFILDDDDDIICS